MNKKNKNDISISEQIIEGIKEHIHTNAGTENGVPQMWGKPKFKDLQLEDCKESIQKFIDFLKDFLQNIGYTKFMLESDLSRDKLFKIDKLFDEIKKQQAKGRFDIEDFITLIDSYYAYHLDIENDDPEIESGVQLMTAHGSKGKEF